MFEQTESGDLRVDELRKQFGEFKLGQLSAMTIAKRSEQLLKCKRVSAALADADA